ISSHEPGHGRTVAGPWVNGDGDAAFEPPATTPTCRRYSDRRRLSTRDRAPDGSGGRGVPCPDRTALRSCRRRSWARPSANHRWGGHGGDGLLSARWAAPAVRHGRAAAQRVAGASLEQCPAEPPSVSGLVAVYKLSLRANV